MALTPEEFTDAMREALERGRDEDEEQTHKRADNLMCDLLKSLGYEEGVAVYLKSGRWYA